MTFWNHESQIACCFFIVYLTISRICTVTFEFYLDLWVDSFNRIKRSSMIFIRCSQKKTQKRILHHINLIWNCKANFFLTHTLKKPLIIGTFWKRYNDDFDYYKFFYFLTTTWYCNTNCNTLEVLGETNLIYCSTGPTDPGFARKKKIIIWIHRLAIYNSPFLYCCWKIS